MTLWRIGEIKICKGSTCDIPFITKTWNHDYHTVACQIKHNKKRLEESRRKYRQSEKGKATEKAYLEKMKLKRREVKLCRIR